MGGWLIFGALVVALVGILAWRVLAGRREAGYSAVVEYWVYVTGEQLPKTEALMDRMISSNPHNRPGRPCIGAREGMLFSDVRLHIAMAKRAKNPEAFRPDLFEDGVEPSAETLASFAECPSLVVVRFSSAVRLKDRRHLQFIPHMADAVADLAGGRAVYDRVSGNLWTAEQFTAALAANSNADRPDFHLRVRWERQDDGFVALTAGLRKTGRREAVTTLQSADHETLAVGLLLRAAQTLYRDLDAGWPLEFEEAGDGFVLEDAGRSGSRTQVRLLRRAG